MVDVENREEKKSSEGGSDEGGTGWKWETKDSGSRGGGTKLGPSGTDRHL